MYSSLERVDTSSQRHGEPVAIQTDHRDAAEMEASRDLSTVFALCRALQPRRQGYSHVQYACAETPPQWFVELLHLGGADVEIMPHPDLISGGRDFERAGQLVGLALYNLAQRVQTDLGVPLDFAGLQQAEQHYASQGLVRDEENEIEYWTAVVELAAFAGEVFRAEYGGNWETDGRAEGTLPFILRTDADASFNVFSRCEWLFYGGIEQGPSSLVAGDGEATPLDGPPMLSIQPATWEHRESATCEPLLDTSTGRYEGIDIPLVVYGTDQPDSFAYSLQESGETADLVTLRREAIATVKEVEVEIAEVGELPLLIVHSAYYASEKLLDTDFMIGLQQQLGTHGLLATVPIKSRLLVMAMDAGGDPHGAARMIAGATAKMQHDEPDDPISSTIFMVMDGNVSGVAQAMASS